MSSPESKTSGGFRFIDPVLIEPHFSTRIYHGYLRYLREKIGDKNLEHLIHRAGLPLDYLQADFNWVSEVFADRFYEAVSQESGIDSDYSYRAGKMAITGESTGLMYSIATQLLDPSSLFRQLLRFSKKFNKADRLEILSITDDSLKLKFVSHRITKYFKEATDSWRGYLESVPTIYGLPPAMVSVSQLDVVTATFEVKWVSGKRFFALVRGRLVFGLSALSTAVLTVVSALGLASVSSFLSSVAFGLSMVGLWALQFLTERYRSKLAASSSTLLDLEAITREMDERFSELLQAKSKLDRRYKEANLLSSVIQRIISSLDFDELIQATTREIKKSLNYDRVIFLNHDKIRNSLRAVATQGFTGDALSALNKYEIRLSEITPDEHHLGNVFKERKSILVAVTSEYFSSLSEEGKVIIRALGSQSFLACTVATENGTYGMLLVDYIREGAQVTEDDLHIIKNLSNQLAICLDNIATLDRERGLRKAFQKFVPREVIDSMTGQSETNYADGVSREMTILFSDLREFTKRSAEVDPKVLVAALRYYFNVMTEIVYRNDGIVDKFIGDGMMAIFNAFGNTPNHKERALAAARDMQFAMTKVNEWLKSNLFRDPPFKPFEIAMGIHSGLAIVGNLGSDAKSEFTAIGESVNIAARICGVSKQFKSNPIVFSEYAAPEGIFSQMPTTDLGPTDIRGTNPLRLYLLGKQAEQEKAA